MSTLSILHQLSHTFDTGKTLDIKWRLTQLNNFLRMLQKEEKNICSALKSDLGKSYFETFSCEIAVVRTEIINAINHLESWMKPTYTSNHLLNIGAISKIKSIPLGVVLIMGAWNYPIQLTLMPFVGAIAAGNCVVIKPGSYAKQTALWMANAIPTYFDNESIQVILGNRDTTTELLQFKFDHIFFTGSTKVGKIVAQAAAKHLTPVTLELGGKSPAVIDSSADLALSVKRIVWASFLNFGQTCVRPDFCLVEKSIAVKVINLMVDTIKEMYSLNPQKSPWFGRCINLNSFNRLKNLVTQSDKLIYDLCII